MTRSELDKVVARIVGRLQRTDPTMIEQFSTCFSNLDTEVKARLIDQLDHIGADGIIRFLIANTLFADWVRRFDVPLQPRATPTEYCEPVTTVLRPRSSAQAAKDLRSFTRFTKAVEPVDLPLDPTLLEIDSWLNLYIHTTHDTPTELLGFGKEINQCGYTHQQLLDELLDPLQDSSQREPDFSRYPVIALMHVLWRYMYGYFLNYYGSGESDDTGPISANREIHNLWLNIHQRLSHPVTFTKESLTFVSTEDLQLTPFQIQISDYHLPSDPRVLELVAPVMENIYIDAWEKELIDKSPSEQKFRSRDWSPFGIHSAKALFREAIPIFAKANYA